VQAPDSPLADDRITLRPYEMRDVDAIVDGFGDASVTRWFPVPLPFDRAQAAAYVRDCRNGWRHGVQATFAVIERSSGSLVGGVDVDEIDHGGGTGDVGYWIAAGARGNGYAAAAVELVSTWALADVGLQRLTLLAEPENAASIAVAERAGFRRDVLLEAHDTDWRDGRVRDFVRFVRER
jgi:RimJ/RimL family protein N-acetyltransferase